MDIKKVILAGCAAAVLSSCSTSANFVLPENTKIRIADRPQTYEAGKVATRPYFWNAAGGVKYSLVDQNGNEVQNGKLATRFRIASIFWPPYAFIYWPMGLDWPCYNLQSGTPTPCQ